MCHVLQLCKACFIGKVAHSIVAVKVAETAAGELDEITSKSRAAPRRCLKFSQLLLLICVKVVYAIVCTQCCIYDMPPTFA